MGKKKREPRVIPDNILRVIPPHLDPQIFGPYFNEDGKKRCWMCKEYKDPLKEFYCKGRDTRCKKCDGIKKARARARAKPPQYVLNARARDVIKNWPLRGIARQKVRALAKKLGVSIRDIVMEELRQSRIDKAGDDNTAIRGLSAAATSVDTND